MSVKTNHRLVSFFVLILVIEVIHFQQGSKRLAHRDTYTDEKAKYFYRALEIYKYSSLVSHHIF